MPPFWLHDLAAIEVPLAIASALAVAADIFVLGRRQRMGVMDAVWPLTMLYWGPLGLPFYLWFGRAAPAAPPPPGAGAHRHMHQAAGTPMWQAVFKGCCHCGAGCALGDFIGDWTAVATGCAPFGSPLAGKYVLAFGLAYGFGIAFQFFSIAPMRGLGFRDGVAAAIKVDTLSLLAYEVGMFAAMGVRAALYPGLPQTGWAYWLLMQIAMLLGFATTYPMNRWLIARGIKEKM